MWNGKSAQWEQLTGGRTQNRTRADCRRKQKAITLTDCTKSWSSPSSPSQLLSTVKTWLLTFTACVQARAKGEWPRAFQLSHAPRLSVEFAWQLPGQKEGTNYAPWQGESLASVKMAELVSCSAVDNILILMNLGMEPEVFVLVLHFCLYMYMPVCVIWHLLQA